MAAYRPYAPQPSFPPPPSQNPIPPRPLPLQHPVQPRPQFSQGWNFNAGGGTGSKSASNANSSAGSVNLSGASYLPYNPPPPPPQTRDFPYQPTPLPPPESSYAPPPPPPTMMQPSQQPPMAMYYPSSQHQQIYSQYNSAQQEEPPPPPPPLPPPAPPPPPPPPQSKDTPVSDRKAVVDSNRNNACRERERGDHDRVSSQKLPDMAGHRENNSNVNGNMGKVVETDEERRLRKKKEYEKQKLLVREKEKALGVSSSGKGHGLGHESVLGSRMGDRRASGTTQLLSTERIENRLKKPTTFLCKMKFRNELPDPSAQPKYMSFKKDPDRFTRYTITSLEKNWKPELHVEPDLGIPLDLLDLSVYNPPKGKSALAPEDEELIRDDVVVTPVKKDGIRKKDRPTDKGVSWLVKTQYISPVSLESAKQSLTEKQAKELREKKSGQKILNSVNNRERQIKDIETSFEAAKTVPVHATNKNLYPVEVLPLLPDFERYEDQFVVASFDNAPTADSEAYNKLNKSVLDEQEAKAIMKSYVATGVDPNKKEQFLAYMVPSANELSKDIHDPDEDISYSWVREYNWDVRGDDTDDPSTYLVSFGDTEACYVPLPTKLNLRKKRASDGRSTDEIEHFPAPASITVRQRPTVAAIELKDPEVGLSSRGNTSRSKMAHSDDEDGMESPEKLARYSGEEDYMSD